MSTRANLGETRRTGRGARSPRPVLLVRYAYEWPERNPAAVSGAPTLSRMETLAAQLRAAFNAKDMDTFRGLLAADARWGDTCRSRSEIIAHFTRLLNDRVRASIVETTTGTRGVACLVEVEWPDPENAGRDRQRFYQVYVVTEGYVTEIQGHDDWESALGAIST
jgi:SnoaL-like domain